MFIKKEKIDGKNKFRQRTIVYLKCDQCFIEFKKTGAIKKIESKNIHFCSRNCASLSKSNGILRKKIELTCLNKYGAISPLKNKDVINKKNATNMEKYGSKCPVANIIVREKAEKTNIEKYGVKNASSNNDIKEKRKQSVFNKYGTEYVFQNNYVKEKINKTNLEKYGTEILLRNADIKNKIKDTCINKYGVENPFQNEEIKDKIKKTNLEKYGVENVFQNEEIRKKINFIESSAKCHQTKKEKGIYGKSKMEDDFYLILCNIFSESDIERQKIINSWSIDFYIKSLNLYIQFDGEYWHGLNTTEEELLKKNNKQAKHIYNTFLKDKKQDAYFLENNLKLLRITDSNFKKSDFKHYLIEEIEKINVYKKRDCSPI